MNERTTPSESAFTDAHVGRIIEQSSHARDGVLLCARQRSTSTAFYAMLRSNSVMH